MKYPFLDLAGVNAPYIDELRAAACRVIDSGRFIGGDEVAEFESELASALRVGYAVGVGNGLDALRLILRAYMELGVMKRGDEVIVPVNSFVASALAVTDCGLTVRFADVEESTANLDWNRLPLTGRTRAVMPVHLYGRLCAIPGGLPDSMVVIEDNAQAIGASLGGRYAGALGHAAGMSFYPTKNVGALGDAGAVTTADPELARVVAMLRNYGTDRPYHNVYAGVNSRLDPVQAAMLRVKLLHIDRENAARRANAEAYLTGITNPLITLPSPPAEPSAHVWHQFVVRLDPGLRDAFRSHMAAAGVGTDVHYPTPINQLPCYAPAYGREHFPVADRLALSSVSLPISPATTPADAAAIAAIANDFRG